MLLIIGPLIAGPDLEVDFRISAMGPDGNPAFDALSPAVSYNQIDPAYLVAWVGDDDAASLGDDEYRVFVRRVSRAGDLLDPDDVRISDAIAVAEDGSVAIAHNTADNEYLVVWAGIADPDVGEVEIFGQRLDGVSGAEIGANDFRISALGPDGDSAFATHGPAVAYNSNDNEYLVVWDGNVAAGDHEVFGQRLSGATGAAVGPDDFPISDMGPDGDGAAMRAAVAHNATDNEYLVVWEGLDGMTALDNEFEIYGQRLSAAGVELGTNDFRLSDMGPDGDGSSGATDRTAGFDAFDPAVAYGREANEYLVVWEGDDDTGALVEGELEIHGQRVAAAGVEVGLNDFRISDMGPDGDPSFDARSPAVIYNNGLSDPGFGHPRRHDEYLVVWAGDTDDGPLANGEQEIFAQRLNATAGFAVGTNDLRVSDAGPDGDPDFDADHPAAAANTSNNNEYLVIWEADDDALALADEEREVFGRRFRSQLTGYVLDRFGGVNPWAAPNPAAPTPYFGFDIARDLELASVGFYVLDGFGGIHAGNGADAVGPATPYFGFDIARDLELATTGFYVLDGFGGSHAGGGAPAIAAPPPYFGFDVAVDLELAPIGIYVLDAFGGVHAADGAPAVSPATPYFGFDIARDIELAQAGYYVLDGLGGVHHGGSAPPMDPPTPYFWFDAAEDLVLASHGYYVLDAYGGIHDGGNAPRVLGGYKYFGFDVAIDLETR